MEEVNKSEGKTAFNTMKNDLKNLLDCIEGVFEGLEEFESQVEAFKKIYPGVLDKRLNDNEYLLDADNGILECSNSIFETIKKLEEKERND